MYFSIEETSLINGFFDNEDSLTKKDFVDFLEQEKASHKDSVVRNIAKSLLDKFNSPTFNFDRVRNGLPLDSFTNY